MEDISKICTEFNIFLIGFMGSGKTTVANYLKETYCMDMIEMDHEISEREGMSISDIFALHGEDYFRDLETRLLEEVQKKKHVVVSCGGGVPLRAVNVAAMRNSGRIIFLQASAETIYERVKDSHDRPLLEGNKNVAYISELLEKRKEKYEATGDIFITTDGKEVFQIGEEIMQKLNEWENANKKL